MQYKLDFHGNVFHWAAGHPEAEEVNVQSHFQEPGEETYVRENLAAKFMQVRRPSDASIGLPSTGSQSQNRPQNRVKSREIACDFPRFCGRSGQG